MKDYLKELNEIKHVSFSTVNEKNKPKSRIFDIMDVKDTENGSEIYFLTGKSKDVTLELKSNRFVALNVFTTDLITYRVEGEVEFTGDKDYLLSLNPKVAKMYEGREEELVSLNLKVTKAIKMDLSQGKPIITEY